MESHILMLAHDRRLCVAVLTLDTRSARCPFFRPALSALSGYLLARSRWAAAGLIRRLPQIGTVKSKRAMQCQLH